MNHALQQPSESLVEMPRMHSLSDAVFAVALTLLVLEIRIPEGIGLDVLPVALIELAPRVLVYLISFGIIGGAWGSHQRILGQMQRGDGPLVWFNLLSLLWVTLLPASAALLGRFPQAFPPIALFAVNVVLIQLAALWLWRHASRHGLTNPDLDERVVEGIARRLGLSAVVFGLSIALAPFSTTVVYACWIAVFALLFTTDWLSWQQAAKREEFSILEADARKSRIHIEHAAGRLTMRGAEAFDGLVQGVCGGGLERRVDRHGDLAEIKLQAGTRHGFLSLRYPWAWGPANALDWTLEIGSRVDTALEIAVAGGQAILDLTATRVNDLKLHAAASTVELTASAAEGHTRAHIEVSAASITIRIPPDVAGRIRYSGLVARVEVDRDRYRTLEEGHLYESADYERHDRRTEIELALSMGSARVL